MLLHKVFAMVFSTCLVSVAFALPAPHESKLAVKANEVSKEERLCIPVVSQLLGVFMPLLNPILDGLQMLPPPVSLIVKGVRVLLENLLCGSGDGGEDGGDMPSEGGDDKPTEDGHEEPTEDGDDKPAEDGDDKPAEDGDEEATDDGADEPAEGGADEAAEDGGDQPAEDGGDQPAEDGGDQPAEDTDNTEDAPEGDAAAPSISSSEEA